MPLKRDYLKNISLFVSLSQHFFHFPFLHLDNYYIFGGRNYALKNVTAIKFHYFLLRLLCSHGSLFEIQARWLDVGKNYSIFR